MTMHIDVDKAVAEAKACSDDLIRRLIAADDPKPARPPLGFKKFHSAMVRAMLRAFKPVPYMDPVEWCEKNLRLPEETAPGHSGPLRLTSYQKQMLRSMVAPGTRFYVCPKSVQVGYSLTLALAILYTIGYLGLPAAYVSRTDAEVDKFVKQFINPMLKQNPCLARLLRRPKQGDDKDSLNERFFTNGAVFYARTAANDNAARGFTAWIVCCDEIDADEYKARSGGQGSKLDLFRARFTRFHDGRIVAGGSPTNLRTSLTEKEYALSDQQRLFVPCPHCSGVIDAGGFACEDPENPAELKGWQVLKIGDGEPLKPGFVYSLSKSNRAVTSVTYQCAFDPNHQIRQKSPKPRQFDWKAWMDRHSEFRPTAPGGEWRRGKYPGEWIQEQERLDEASGEIVAIPSNAMPGYVGQRIWAAYNPAVSWESLISEKVAAERKGIESIKTFINNLVGEAFEPKISYVERAVNELASRCVAYYAQIPDDVMYLTAGIDAQEGTKDGSKAKRVEISIYGWGRFDTCYFIAHYVIEADPDAGQLYDPKMNSKIEATLDRVYHNSAGVPFKVAASGHDCNYETQNVLNYARARIEKNRLAVRGWADKTGEGCKYGGVIELRGRGKEGQVWRYVDTLLAKNDLAERLHNIGPRIGGIFFPMSVSLMPEIFKHMTSERREVYKQGFKWEKKGHQAGEALDCFVYASAARDWLKASSNVFADIDRLADHLQQQFPKWQIPDTPSLINSSYTGDCQSVQMKSLMPSVDVITPGGIRERAMASVEEPERRPRVHPGLLRKPYDPSARPTGDGDTVEVVRTPPRLHDAAGWGGDSGGGAWG